jgi:hypothetical protein
MYRLAVALCALLFVLAGPSLAAAIGVAMADGSFRIDSRPVVGNATLFEGNQLETDAATPELRLYGGARMRLAANSRGALFQDRLVLEKGMSEVEGGNAYRIEARGLRLWPEGKDAAARVVVIGERRVQAAALSGALRVTTADGTLVALMRSGTALEFAPQEVTGAQASFEMSGCLERRQDRFVLRDTVSAVTEELRGSRLELEVGNMVQVTASVVPGARPIEGAQEVIEITRIRRISGGCATAAQTAPKQGMSGSKKAVIAGVVVGGAGAGAAVYLVSQKKNNNPSTISP